jgi:S-adenosylmethionine hydrolase
LPKVSTTFHGRDIMAPVAAHLAEGIPPEKLGISLERLTSLDWPQANVQPGRIDGTVIEIDSFGNLITNITADMLLGRPTDSRCCVVCSIFETWGIYSAYAQKTAGMLVALIGSSGRLELAVVQDNAAERLGVSRGTPVALAWE